MLTLAEGKELLVTMSSLSKIGIFPFNADWRTGKLTEPSLRRRVVLWSTFTLVTLYFGQILYQIIDALLFNKEARKSRKQALLFASALCVLFPYISLLTFHLTKWGKTNLFLVFNEIFAQDSAKTSHRPWRKMTKDDLFLRYFLLSTAIHAPLSAWFFLLIAPHLFFKPLDIPVFGVFSNCLCLQAVFFLIDSYVLVHLFCKISSGVNIILLICAKAVGDAAKMENMIRCRKRLTYHSLSHLILRAKALQLRCTISNKVTSFIAYGTKLSLIEGSIFYSFFAISHVASETTLTIVFYSAGFLCILFYSYVCYFANQVSNRTEDLHRRLSLKIALVPDSTQRQELLVSIRSLKIVPVSVGGFHAMERESFLIFAQFVSQQVVGLLLAF